jgi:hypothetical protein
MSDYSMGRPIRKNQRLDRSRALGDLLDNPVS